MNKNIPNYQYIIISVNENRRNLTNELLNKVNKSNAFIYNLKGVTPENDNNFLENTDNLFSLTDKKILCCAKSHFNAIEYALKDESPEYSIILEDDVTFLKDNFCELVEEIIEKVDNQNDNNYNNICMIQIGWIPGNNYSNYDTPCSKYEVMYFVFDTINKYDTKLKVFKNFYPFGAQGYIIKKSKIINNLEIRNIFQSKNYNECYNLLSKYDWFNKQEKLFVSDHTINRLLNFITIFPPLIIERNEISTLNHNNITYWDNYFKDFEKEKEKYLNMSVDYQYIIISADKEREYKTINLVNKIKENNINIYTLQATIPNDNNSFLNCINDLFSEYEKKIVCCIKSHFRALEYASLFNSPEFSIILEDDVTFLKENFTHIINNLIDKLKNNKNYENVNMIHIGYIPDNSYDIFTDLPPIEKIKLTNNDSFGLYNSFYAFGAQGYIIRKSALQKDEIIKILHSKSFNECHELVSKYFKTTHKIIGVDHIINRIFEFMLINPPIIIERNEKSTIGNNNINYLINYFNKFPEQKEKYLL